MAQNPILSTTESDKYTLRDTNTILHHIKWASALTRNKNSEEKAKCQNEVAQQKFIKEQSQKDRIFALKMLDLIKEKAATKMELNTVIVKNVLEDVQKGSHLKKRIRKMKRERKFPQPKTLKNPGYQYGFIPKKFSKKLGLKNENLLNISEV